MRYIFYFLFIQSLLSLLLISCNHDKDPVIILQKTISSIDQINSIYYQQTQLRGNTENIENQVQKERTFYYERLLSDSIIGAKAHIYFFDSTYVILEDIYNGNKLIRKHYRDSSARVYDLIKYPEFRKKPFWGKTTPYVIQYMLNYALENKDSYLFELGKDTIINEIDCYSVKTTLRKKALMPGFHKFENDSTRVETMTLFIDKIGFYPQRIRMEVYFIDNADNVYFTDNTFHNMKFNLKLNDSLFNTSDDVIKGFRITEIEP